MKMLNYVIKKVGSEKVTMGSDYPFPLGDLTLGKLIEDLEISEDEKVNIYCNSTLDWLNLKKEQFL